MMMRSMGDLHEAFDRLAGEDAVRGGDVDFARAVVLQDFARLRRWCRRW